MDDITVAAAELRQFIERFEHLEAEKKDIADDQKEVMAEEEAVVEMYKAALGMA